VKRGKHDSFRARGAIVACGWALAAIDSGVTTSQSAEKAVWPTIQKRTWQPLLNNQPFQKSQLARCATAND